MHFGTFKIFWFQLCKNLDRIIIVLFSIHSFYRLYFNSEASRCTIDYRWFPKEAVFHKSIESIALFIFNNLSSIIIFFVVQNTLYATKLAGNAMHSNTCLLLVKVSESTSFVLFLNLHMIFHWTLRVPFKISMWN